MENLRFRTKLIIGVSIIIFIGLTIGFSGIKIIQMTSNDIDLLYQYPFKISNSVRSINIYIHQIQRSVKGLVTDKENLKTQEYIEQMQVSDSLILVSITEINNLFGQNKKVTNSLKFNYLIWKQSRLELIQLIQNKEEITKIEAHEQKLLVLVKKVFESTTIISQETQKQADRYYNQNKVLRDNSTLILFWVLIILTIISIILSLLVSRSILSPIHSFISEIRLIFNENEAIKVEKNKATEVNLLKLTITEIKNAHKKIKENTEKLENFNKELDLKVEERTQELKEKSEIFDSFFNSATDAFVLYDKNLNLLNYNRIAAEYFKANNLHEENLIGQNILKLSSMEEKEERYTNYLKVIETGKPYVAENVMPNSVFKDLHLRIRAFKVGEGLGLAVSNMTEQIKYEEQLKEINVKLKKAKENAEENEVKFRTIFDFSPQPISITDENGIVIDVNNELCVKSKYTKQEIINKNVIDLGFYSIEDRVKFWNELKSKGKVVDLEINFIIKDKTVVTSATFANIIKIGGKPYTLTMFSDITGRKKNELALRESEAKQRLILDSFKDGIYITTSDFTIEYANSALKEKLQTNPVGKICYEALYHQKEICKWCVFDELKIRKKTIEYESVADDGKILEVRNVLIEDNKKLTIFQDVTDREIVEQALRQSEEKYKHLVSNARTAIIKIDTNGIITFMNEFACELFEYSEKEAIGKHVVGIIVPIYDSNNNGLAEMINDFIINTIKESSTIEENENITKSGKRIWVSWANKAILDANGDVAEIISSGVDITDRKTTERALEAAKKEADEANRLKSEFLANMSHEIRTPMNAIIGFSNILQQKIDDPRYKSFIDKIVISGNSLLELINDILDLSKIEAGQLAIQKTKINLFEIINEIPLIFTEISERKRVPLIIEIDENLPKTLLLDGLRLRQILLNLVSNALKFTEKGQVNVSVAFCQNKYSLLDSIDLEIKVKDTGIGIPESQKQKIFEAFRQIEGQSSKKYGGTGLGLAITKSLIELMNGSVSVESKIGEGSIFTIHISGVEFFNNEELIKKEEPVFYTHFSPASILHVEDVAANRELISLYLEEFPELVITEAENGRQALELLKNFKPNLILMDIEMPELNGIDTSKIIKTDDNLRNIPIIALTANATKEEIAKYSIFFNDYITKPINDIVLYKTIAKYLEHQKESIVKKDSNTQNESNELANLNLQIQNLTSNAQFVVEFKTQIVPLHHDLLEILSVDNLKSFAKRIEKIAEAYDISAMKTYSDYLMQSINNFNLGKINQLLNYFKDAIKIVG